MPLSFADEKHLAAIRHSTRDVLKAVLGDECSDAVLLDTPRHRNAGDSLIWMGELRYLADLGVNVTYHTDIGRYFAEDLRRASAGAPVLLQGGGNFGDLYPAHDEFRRHIIRTLPRRRIIMLPQSMHYEHPRRATAVSADYASGTNLTILLRDSVSLAKALAMLPSADLRFCQDMAFGAPLEDVTAGERCEPLVLNRSDSETATGHLDPACPHTDWSFTSLTRLRWGLLIAAGALYRRSPRSIRRALLPVSQGANSCCMRLNVGAAVRQFGRATVVATNRLHAHVLSALLGIPHVVTDNSYGKTAAIYNDYSGRFETAHWATTLDGAIVAATNLAGAHATAGPSSA